MGKIAQLVDLTIAKRTEYYIALAALAETLEENDSTGVIEAKQAVKTTKSGYFKLADEFFGVVRAEDFDDTGFDEEERE